MSERESKYSPPKRRPVGEVVSVTVAPPDEDRPPRPVTITCHDHDHVYELAWTDTPDGPAITDLRITSQNGQPITKRTLARINPERLAAAARRADTPEAAQAWGGTAQALTDAAAAAGFEVPEGHGFEWIGQFRPTEAWARDELAKIQGTPKRGRPRLPDNHYETVAAVARAAVADRARSIARYVQARVPLSTGDEPAVETVNGWLKEAKKRGLIQPGELRKPKRSKETDQ